MAVGFRRLRAIWVVATIKLQKHLGCNTSLCPHLQLMLLVFQEILDI